MKIFGWVSPEQHKRELDERGESARNIGEAFGRAIARDELIDENIKNRSQVIALLHQLIQYTDNPRDNGYTLTLFIPKFLRQIQSDDSYRDFVLNQIAGAFRNVIQRGPVEI